MLFMVVTESESHLRTVAIVGVRCFFTMKAMKSMENSPYGLDCKRGFHPIVLACRAVAVREGEYSAKRYSYSYSISDLEWVFDLGRSGPRSWTVIVPVIVVRCFPGSQSSQSHDSIVPRPFLYSPYGLDYKRWFLRGVARRHCHLAFSGWIHARPRVCRTAADRRPV